MKKSAATVKFYIDPHEDARWWVFFATKKKGTYGRPLNWFTRDIPAPILKQLRKLSKPKARQYIEPHIRQRMDKAAVDFQAMKFFLEEYIKQYGHGLLKEVAKLTGKPMYAKTFYAYFTLLNICPYDTQRRLFMISANRNMPRQLMTICHEIMHFQFIHHYQKYCRQHGLSATQFQDLKESMTVLLNEPQFRKYHIAFDQGYAAHQELRGQIAIYWHRRKSYQTFLDACIEATMRYT